MLALSVKITILSFELVTMTDSDKPRRKDCFMPVIMAYAAVTVLATIDHIPEYIFPVYPEPLRVRPFVPAKNRKSEKRVT